MTIVVASIGEIFSTMWALKGSFTGMNPLVRLPHVLMRKILVAVTTRV